MMTIAIYGSRRQREYLNYIKDFLGKLTTLGFRAVMHRKLYTHLSEEGLLSSLGCCTPAGDSEDFIADYAVSLGGDGTFLRTSAWIAGRQIPIVGVNTGHLGYLTSLAISDLPLLPQALLDASSFFRIERRSLIEVECDELSRRGLWNCALNEVAILKGESASMIVADVWLDSEHLAEYRADGLLVSTPTGSTAYNLSVGGPVVQPELNVHIIAPVAAHSLSMRPLVVDGRSSLRIVAGGRAQHVRLALDGRQVSIACGSEITLRTAPFAALVMQPVGHSFAHTLRLKLHWGED